MEHLIYLSTVAAGVIFTYALCRGVYLWSIRGQGK
jgi:hypothetical protein